MSERERERDLAEALYQEMCSEATAAAVLDLWWHRYLGPDDCGDMHKVLSVITRAAIEAVLARRLSEAARTGPWEETTEEEWRSRLATQCGQTLAARHERDEAMRQAKMYLDTARKLMEERDEARRSAAASQTAALAVARRWAQAKDPERHLTASEQQVMRRALRSSTRLLAGTNPGDAPASTGRQWGDYVEEDGYPGSLLRRSAIERSVNTLTTPPETHGEGCGCDFCRAQRGEP